jgi:hypothetical protein
MHPVVMSSSTPASGPGNTAGQPNSSVNVGEVWGFNQ